MLRPRVVQVVALLLGAGLACAAAALMPRINAGRAALNAFGGPDVLANAPPEYALAVQALGAFRSLIVNIAFIQAENRKQEGRYYDAVQLRNWICKLQPRFPTVWEYQAWDLAWNISVTTYTPEERWNWVYSGVRLLRDEGLRYNPRAVNLYKQLAWIYNNKMSEVLDEFHWDYKRNWAWRMHLVLGPPATWAKEFSPDQPLEDLLIDVTDDPLRETARAVAAANEAKRRHRQEQENAPFRTARPLEERLAAGQGQAPAEADSPAALLAQRAALEELRVIAAAPRTLNELYAQVGETREMVAQLRELGVVITDEPLDEDRYWFDGRLAETFFVRYRQLVDTPALRQTIALSGAGSSPAADPALERFDQIVGVRAGRPGGAALYRFLQRKVLTEVYKLKPERMLYVVENFGPIDWRVVDAHSLYWIAEGLIQGGETVTSFESDKVNTARILFFSLRNLFQRGKLTFEPHPTDVQRSYLGLGPDVNFVEPMHRAFLTYGPLLDPDPGDATGAGDAFRTGHTTFLTEAIRMLYFSDRLAEAEKYYRFLRVTYGRRRHDQSIDPRYLQPLRDFVMAGFYGQVDRPAEVQRAVQDLLYRAYGRLAADDATAYNRLVASAYDIYDNYISKKRGETGMRLKLDPFQDMQINVFRLWFQMVEPDANVTLDKVRLWRVAPSRLKQWVYDDLIDLFRAECQWWGFDVAKAFPEPPGMDQFRQAHPRREIKRPEQTAETPAQPAGD